MVNLLQKNVNKSRELKTNISHEIKESNSCQNSNSPLSPNLLEPENKLPQVNEKSLSVLNLFSKNAKSSHNSNCFLTTNKLDNKQNVLSTLFGKNLANSYTGESSVKSEIQAENNSRSKESEEHFLQCTFRPTILQKDTQVANLSDEIREPLISVSACDDTTLLLNESISAHEPFKYANDGGATTQNQVHYDASISKEGLLDLSDNISQCSKCNSDEISDGAFESRAIELETGSLETVREQDDKVIQNKVVDSTTNKRGKFSFISHLTNRSGATGLDKRCVIAKAVRKGMKLCDKKQVKYAESPKKLTKPKVKIKPPIGAPYAHGVLCIKGTKLTGHAPLLLDSGAERTIMDPTVALALFGPQYKNHLLRSDKPVKMFSATHHKMPFKGFLELEITLGTYTFTHPVSINEFAKGIFLFGNDIMLDRINYHHGRQVSFVAEGHEPIPIYYHLPIHDGHLTNSIIMAPNSSVMANLFVNDLDSLTGKEVFITNDQFDDSDDKPQVIDTTSVIDSEGYALVMLTNPTENQILVSKNEPIATVHFLSLTGDENDDLYDLVTDQSIINHIFKTSSEERTQLLDGTASQPPDPVGLSKLEPIDPTSWYEQIPHDHLNDSQWNKLKQLVTEMGEAFVKSTDEMGLCKYFEAELPLKEGTPYLYSPPRPIPYMYREEADEIMQDYLNLGIIRKSNSPFATNVVCVKRKAVNGVVKLRAATDLRLINNASVPCRFPNTSLDDALAKIGNARYRSSLDFRNAFFQISIAESSRQYTSFFCNGIQYEYTRLPMGHISAMGIFCMMMSLLCENFPNGVFFADYVMCITIDKTSTDEIVYDKHIEHLREMFRRIIYAGLKLNPAKCYFANHSSQNMDWLGFTLENCLLLPQKSKVEKVVNFPTPTSKKQAQSFVSLASFYRRFIKSFAAISKPIYEATKIEPFIWTKECDEAAQQLKIKLTSYPILRIPQFDQPFQIWTDASASAIGAVLTQVDQTDGRMHPCAYASRKFNDTEMNMSTPCKELLAVCYALHVWTIYILGQKCTLYTDCRAWTFLKLASAKSGKISRLALVVQEFDIDISYVPATKNLAADGLSRQYDTGEVKYDDISGIRDPKLEQLGAPSLDGQSMPLSRYMVKCDEYIKTNDWSRLASEVQSQGNYVECFIQSTTLLHHDFAHTRMVTYHVRHIAHNSVQCDQIDDSFPLRIALVALKDSCFSKEGFAAMQRRDPVLKAIHKQLVAVPLELLAPKFKNYFLDNHLVYKKVTDEHGATLNVLCIPELLVDYLLNYYHSSLLSGHIGPAKLYTHLRKLYYWPNMIADIKRFTENCLNCQYNTKYPVKHAIGTMIVPQYPNHIVHVDILSGMPKARNGATVLFLMYDGFSKFCFALPLRNAHADRIVSDFMQYYVPILGAPHCMHSDRGQNVDGLLMHRIARMLGMRKARTPTYNPNSNPCEVLCGLIGDLMRKWVSLDDQKQWPHFLAYILYALNFTTNTSTGFTPASLMLGRLDPQPLVPLIPVDHEVVTENEFLESIRRFQEYAFQLTRARHEKLRDKRKEAHNANAYKHNFKPGDFVLVRDLQPAPKGQLKLRPKYRGPYRVIKAFESSLQVIPWDESERLDELNDSPRFVQRMNEVKPFLTDTVPVRLCKPCKFEVKLPPKFDTNLMDKIIELLADYECPDFESVYDDDPDRLEALMADSDGTQSRHGRPSQAPTGTDSTVRRRPPRGDGDDDSGDSDGPDGDLPVLQPPPPTPASSAHTQTPQPSLPSLSSDSSLPPAPVQSRADSGSSPHSSDSFVTPPSPLLEAPYAGFPPPLPDADPPPRSLRRPTNPGDRPIRPTTRTLDELIEADLQQHPYVAQPPAPTRPVTRAMTRRQQRAMPTPQPESVLSPEHDPVDPATLVDDDLLDVAFDLPAQDPALHSIEPPALDTPDMPVHDRLSAASRPIPPMVDPDLLQSPISSPDLQWDDPILVPDLVAAETRPDPESPEDLGILPEPYGFETPSAHAEAEVRRWLRSSRNRPHPLRPRDGRVARDIFSGGRHPSGENFAQPPSAHASPASDLGVQAMQRDTPCDRTFSAPPSGALGDQTYDVLPESSPTATPSERHSLEQGESRGPEQSGEQHGAIPRGHRPAIVERPHTRAHDAIAGPVPTIADQVDQQEELKKLERERRLAERQQRLEKLSKPKSSKQRSPKGSRKSNSKPKANVITTLFKKK